MGLFKRDNPPLDKYTFIYMEGLNAGYKMAFETLLPLLKDGLTRSAKALHDEAVDATLKRLGLAGDTR